LSVAGNRARALRAYRELEDLLIEELGVSPSPETAKLFDELLGLTPPSEHDPEPPGRQPEKEDRETGKGREL